jgi:hypothetical protein
VKVEKYGLTLDHLIPTAIGVIIVINLTRIGAAKLGTMNGVLGRVGHTTLSLVTFSGGA